MVSSYELDKFWKIYLAEDTKTEELYDLRLCEVKQGDVKKVYRMKQEIALWVWMRVLFEVFSNMSLYTKILFNTMLRLWLKRMALLVALF